jgi:hypothetical protein
VDEEVRQLDYARPELQRRKAWKRAAIWIGATLVLIVGGRALVEWAIWTMYPPIPPTYIWVWRYDLNGDAVVETPQFTISFEGRAFDEYVTSGDCIKHWSSGNYMVDGRNAQYSPWAYFGGSDMGYSQWHRTLAFDRWNKRFVYSHVLRTLSVDGVTYSTAGGRVFLRVRPDGKVVKQESGPVNFTATR